MAHSACDFCGTEIGRFEQQYLAVVDIRPTVGVTDTDEDPADRDHLQELDEMLETAHEGDAEEAASSTEFLLCHDCCRRFRENPVPREAAVHFDFSAN